MSDGSPFDDVEDDDSNGADDADVAELFEDVDVEAADEDVWEELSTGTGPAAEEGDLFEQFAEESPTDEGTATVEADGEEAVVPKNRFCQRCEYFSDPPAVSCLHPGTEIEAVVDSERFRVRNCPVVEERHGTVDVLDTE
jgi:hypothetical protein